MGAQSLLRNLDLAEFPGIPGDATDMKAEATATSCKASLN
jgi:hypothetical protein